MSAKLCPSCQNEMTAEQQFCGHCGAPTVGATMALGDATRTSVGDASSQPISSTPAGRFTAGDVIASRYRIVGLIGKGGMGEVYRADDLKLERPVALKFLPEILENDPGRLSRLLNEVRVALTVSHANVCRVHDIQQEAGRHFITMEFVDGDDLSVLLRRIGRLPQDKALQIARQLCAGLGAAHAAGVLHRDLKPANIMIDGRGQVKITDFGLAGLSGGIAAGEVAAGTPAYMAPEQLNGKSVSEASDLYALGLVLYEVYTGKTAFEGTTAAEIRANRTSAPTSPASHITDIDPAVERVILRCLAVEPNQRPSSALAVSAALPGGDPLAAALAAGETPAPGLVAESGAIGSLRAVQAWSLLGLFVVMLGFCIAASESFQSVPRAKLPKSGPVLEENARLLLASLGYDEPFRDSVYEFEYNQDYVRELRASGVKADFGLLLERRQPTIINFGYRQSPDWIIYESTGTSGDWVSRSPSNIPGDISLRLDPVGRLIWLVVIPPDFVSQEVGDQSTNWSALLAAAGFEAGELSVETPEWLPRVSFDERQAWSGFYPDTPEVAVRLEAAAWQGKVVAFRIIEPWTKPITSALRPLSGPGSGTGVMAVIGPMLWAFSLLSAIFFAWRNMRSGRGDMKTALRFAVVLAVLRMVWYLGSHHVVSGQEVGTFTGHTAWAAYRFTLAFIFYLAVEPYARKLWPHMLTSWVRLFDRRFNDPLVGRDLLLGLVYGTGSALVQWASPWLATRFEWPVFILRASDFTTMSLDGFLGALLGVSGSMTTTIFGIFIMWMLVMVFRLVLRRDSLAVLCIVVFTFLFAYNSGQPIPSAVGESLALGVIFWLSLFRAGLLTFVVMMMTDNVLHEMPLTFDLSVWWSTPTLLVLITTLGLAVWGFRATLAGRTVFRDRLFESE